MTEQSEEEKQSQPIGFRAICVGVIGGLLLELIDIYVKQLNLNKNLSLCVPFISYLILDVLSWCWAFIAPPNANAILMSRKLDKTIREIDKQLADPNITKSLKNKLMTSKEECVLGKVNIHKTEWK